MQPEIRLRIPFLLEANDSESVTQHSELDGYNRSSNRTVRIRGTKLETKTYSYVPSSYLIRQPCRMPFLSYFNLSPRISTANSPLRAKLHLI